MENYSENQYHSSLSADQNKILFEVNNILKFKEGDDAVKKIQRKIRFN